MIALDIETGKEYRALSTSKLMDECVVRWTETGQIQTISWKRHMANLAGAK